MANYGVFLKPWGGAITYQGNNVILNGYAETNPGNLLSYIKLSWSGKDANGNPVSGTKTLYSISYTEQIACITGSASCTINCSVKYPGNYTVTVSNGILLETWNGSWTEYSPPDASSHNYKVDVEAQERNGVINIGAWDYGSAPDMSGTFKSFSITWSGYDSNGNPISGTGTPTIAQRSKTYMEADLSTKLAFQYYGNATGTLVTTSGTYTNKTSWGSKRPITNSDTDSSLTITSFVIDDANTTGMKNGKYVIGTKLKLKVTVKSTHGTKSVRFILTGAKESDNEWSVPYQTTITADSTAVATGVIHMKCIVTDYKGNTASKTLDVTINGEGDSYYAYYFFNTSIQDHCKNNIAAVNIIFYNVYNVMKDQFDPRKKTIQCYGHNYKTYNDLKNKKHKDSDLTFLTSFVIPDEKNVSKTTVTLTENEIKKLKGFKGLAFKIQNKDALTVHDIKCEIEFIYK